MPRTFCRSLYVFECINRVIDCTLGNYVMFRVFLGGRGHLMNLRVILQPVSAVVQFAAV